MRLSLLVHSMSLLIALAVAAPVAAVEGVFDAGFGVQAIDSEMGDEFLSDVVRQPDGRFVVVWFGDTSEPGCTRTSTGIARFEPDGGLDATFGDAITPGRTKLLGFCGEGLLMFAAAIQPDGKIVLAGSRALPNNRQAVMIRLHPDGSIDTGFGVAGLYTLARAAQVQPSDTITDLVLTDGDTPSLVGVGFTRDRVGDLRTYGLAVVVDAGGQHVPVGNTFDSSGLVFHREGTTRPQWLCDTFFTSVAPAAAVPFVGGLVVCTKDGAYYAYPVVWRFDTAGGVATRRAFSFDPADGELDPNTLTAGQIDATGSRVLADPDGRFWVLAAQGNAQTGLRPAIAAVDGDLAFDGSRLGGAGRQVLPDLPGFTWADLALQAGGKVVVAGTWNPGTGIPGYGALRIDGATGAVDTGFGPQVPGFAFTLFGADSAAARRVLPDPGTGGLVLAGTVTRASDGALLPTLVRLVEGPGSGGGDDPLFEDGFE